MSDTLAELLALFEAGLLGELENRCREILLVEFDNPEIIYLLGRALLDRADVVGAIHQLRRAAELAPDWPEVHVNMAAALLLRNRTEEAAYYIRRATVLDQNDPEARNILGVVLLTEGRVSDAAAEFLRAIEARPNYPDALHNLGGALCRLGRYSDAIDRFRSVIALEPNNSRSIHSVGAALMALGDTVGAARAFRQALNIAPSNETMLAAERDTQELLDRAESVTEFVRAGISHLEQGDNDSAESMFRRALESCPESAEALRGMATVLIRARRPAEARALIERRLWRSALDVEILNLYGVALRDLDCKRDAAQVFRKALEVDADNPNVVANLALTLVELGGCQDAIPICRRAVEMWPSSAETRNALGVALANNGDDRSAAAAFEAALKFDPGSASANSNLGATLCHAGDTLRAVRPLKRALKLDPSQADTLENLAVVYLSRGRQKRGEALLRRAIALKPNSPSMRFNLSMSLLAREQFDEGWANYEYRLRMPAFAEPSLSAPKWTGEACPDGTLLVYDEQGFGDTIQFCRYLAAARERWKGTVRFFTRPELAALLNASELPVEIVVRRLGDPYPKTRCDAFISLMSLPGLFGTTADTIPAEVPYLRAPADRVEKWRDRFDGWAGLKVGVVWAGSAVVWAGSVRHCDVSQLAPLAGIPGARYYSLQRGPEAEQLQGAEFEIVDIGKDLVDFADTAAVLSLLDLLISVDTAPAHLAGALGRPACILLPKSPDWRWMADRDDSPWYPSVRLFRQRRQNEWTPVWRRVADEVRRIAGAVGQNRAAVS